MAERVRVREIDDDEGNRLLRIVRRGTGSVVTWRRAQMVLLSAQGMPVSKIAEVTFTSQDRVRDVIHNFNADGFDSLYPKYKGGRPPTFTLAQRREIKKIAKSRPAEHGLPFSTWSLAKLADFLVAEGVVEDISHEGLRVLLREEGVSFQADKDLEAVTRPGLRGQEGPRPAPVRDRTARGRPEKATRRGVLHGRVRAAQPAAPPRPAVGHGAAADPDRAAAPAAGDLHPPARGAAPVRRLRPGPGPALRAHQEAQEPGEFLEFCRYLRSLYPPEVRIAIVWTTSART